MTLNLITDSGALRAITLGERPKSFSEYKELGRTLVIYPEKNCDLVAKMHIGAAEMRAPYEILVSVSYLLGCMRGIPEKALTVEICGRVYEVPVGTPCRENVVLHMPRCKEIFTNEITLEGGMTLRTCTVRDLTATRILEAESDTDYPIPLLRRLTVAPGAKSTERAIAYRKSGEAYRFAVTDTTPTYDAAVHLAHHLAARGVRGKVSLIARSCYYTVSLNEGGITLIARVTGDTPKEL